MSRFPASQAASESSMSILAASDPVIDTATDAPEQVEKAVGLGEVLYQQTAEEVCIVGFHSS